MAPPFERVPPPGYGGTERVVHALAVELARRGHEVTLFGTGDSEVPGPAAADGTRAGARHGRAGTAALPWLVMTQLAAMRDAARPRHRPQPSRLGWPRAGRCAWTCRSWRPSTAGSTCPARPSSCGPPAAITSPSPRTRRRRIRARRGRPSSTTASTCGTRRSCRPRQRGDELCFVGRMVPEKGVLDAIEIARSVGPPAAHRGQGGRPARRGRLSRARGRARHAHRRRGVPGGAVGRGPGSPVRGEPRHAHARRLAGAVRPGRHRVARMRHARCSHDPPARSRRSIREGVDGWLADDPATLATRVDDVASLDRDAIRASVLDRFSATRMVDGYLGVYRHVRTGA